MTTLSVANIGKRYGTLTVLDDVSLEVGSGEFCVLVGPSGCGKSTLLNIIAGLDRPSTGDILIGGRTVTAVAPKDRDIAMVFQSYALYPSMTVRQNICFGMQCRNIPRARQDEAVSRVARLLQIEPLLNRRPAQLSGGQRQRVAMGRALVRDPLLFLFDEPLSNLDAKLRVEMRMEIKQLHATLGATMVYVTHDQVEAMTMATRIAVMRGGVLQQYDMPDQVYNHPANLFVAQFMGSPPMNTLPARLDGGDVLSAVVGAGRPDAIRVPLPAAGPGARAFLDREVVLGLRPECVADTGRRFGDDPRTAVLVDATVEMAEPTGAETIVLLRLGGERVLGRVSPDERLPPGTVGRFSLDTRKACLFDPQTGALIA